MNKIISILFILLNMNCVFAQDTLNSKLIEFKENNAKKLTYWQIDSLQDKGMYIENYMNCIRVDTIDLATDSLLWSEYLLEVEIVDNDECEECTSSFLDSNNMDYKFYKIKVNRFIHYFTSDFSPTKKITRIEYLILPNIIRLKQNKKYNMLVGRCGSLKYLKYISIVSPKSIFIDTRDFSFVGSFNNPNKELDKLFKKYKKCVKKPTH